MADPQLSTSRLRLRELAHDDLADLRGILQDDLTMTAYEGAFTETETVEWLRRMQQRYTDDGFGLWAVLDRKTGEFLGQCGITRQWIEDDEVIEVGYLVNRAHWHHGYATEAATVCVDWAFETLGLAEVYAKIRDTNLASQAVAGRLGMTPRRGFLTYYRGKDLPHTAFAVTDEVWRARPRTLEAQ